MQNGHSHRGASSNKIRVLINVVMKFMVAAWNLCILAKNGKKAARLA